MGDLGTVQAKAPQVIIVTNGNPIPKSQNANIGDKLQFVNDDPKDYQILGLKIARYFGTHILLPAKGSVTLTIDDATPRGPFNYTVSRTNVWYGLSSVSPEAVAGAIPFDAGDGGGQIIVGP